MNNNRLSPFYKNIALWLLIGLVVTMLFNFFNRSQLAKEKAQLSYTKFLELVNEGKVARIVVQGDEITGERLDGKSFHTYSPHDPDLIKFLRDKGIEITAKPVDDSPGIPPS